jgi:hypothetical protein
MVGKLSKLNELILTLPSPTASRTRLSFWTAGSTSSTRIDPLYDRKVAASKLAGWKVVATTPDGPPIGSDYYAPFLEAVAARPTRARRREKVSNGP